MKFKKDFNIILNKIKNRENFAFTRFSDGELYILQNRKVQISEDKCFVREKEHVDPIPYEEFTKLLAECKFAITDSGGLQEELSFFGKICIVCIDRDWETHVLFL